MSTDPKTIWYRDLNADLKRNGVARHKDIEMHSTADILEFFKGYVAPLITSLRDEPYHDPKGGFESTAVLDANGMICKTGSGNHRFNICHVLGVERFPLKIVGIHEDWFAKQAQGQENSIADALEMIAEAGRRFS